MPDVMVADARHRAPKTAVRVAAPSPDLVRGQTQEFGSNDRFSIRDSLTLTDRNNCKPRPRTSKGNGSSRAFVPWCGPKGRR